MLDRIFDFVINIIYRRRNKTEQLINRIVQRYLNILDNKILGYPGIPSLIESGAAQLSKSKHLTKVCEIITQYGKPNPVPKWVFKYINKKELLKFIKWQAKDNRNHYSDYYNEKDFAKPVQRYKEKNT